MANGAPPLPLYAQQATDAQPQIGTAPMPPDSSGVSGTLPPDFTPSPIPPSAQPGLTQSQQNVPSTPSSMPQGPMAPSDPGQMNLPPPYQGPANRGGPVKNALTRMLYGMGQIGLRTVGLPTDWDIQRRNFNQALQANDLQIAQAHQQLQQQAQQYQESAITWRDPYTGNVYTAPPSAMAKIQAGAIGAGGRVQSTELGKRYISVPNVGLVDTKLGLDPAQAGEPEVVAGTQQPSITVTQAHINKYGLPQEYLGQTLTAPQFSTAMNAAARWAPTSGYGTAVIQTDEGPKTITTPRGTQRGYGGAGAPPTPATTAPGPTTTAPGAATTTPAPSDGGVPAATRNRVPRGSIARPILDASGQPVQSQAAFNEFDSKYLQPANAIEKSYQMMNTAYNEYQTAKAKNQDLPTGAQSMLALSNHLATTFGGVRGARITKDLISEHLGARSISDDALVAIQRLTNGDVLSPNQWQAFHDLIGQSRNTTWQIASQYGNARNLNVTPFLPPDLQQSLGRQRGGVVQSASPTGGGQEQPVYRNGQLIGYTIDGKTISRQP